MANNEPVGIDSEIKFLDGQGDMTSGAGQTQVTHAREDGVQIHQTGPGHTQTVGFEKTFEHYVGPTQDYAGLTLKTRTDMEGKSWIHRVWDNNFQFIPYNTLIASATPREHLQHELFAGAYRIKKQGFKIKLLDVIYDQVRQTGAGSQFQTTFVDNIPLKIYSDPHHHWRMENILPQTGMESLYEVNWVFQKQNQAASMKVVSITQ